MRKIVFKTLEIENFRNYEKMSFDFEPNRFCVLTGPNGSGKTTLAVDAICWCVYDETSKGRKGDSVIRKRSGKNTRVVLRYDVDDDKYCIENNRKHDEYGDIKLLTKNGVSISGATRAETNKRIAEILMPKDVFKNCLLFSQYINKPFAEMGDTDQKNIFDLMMGFEKFNEYYEKTKSYMKVIEAELSKLNEELLLLNENYNRNKELLDSELKSKEDFIEAFESRKRELTQEIARLSNENTRLREEISRLDNPADKCNTKRKEISDIISKITILKNKFDNEKRLIDTKINSDKSKEQSNIDKDYADLLTDSNTELETIKNEYTVLKQEINAKNESLKSDYLKKKNEIEEPIRKDLDVVTGEYKDAIGKSHILVNTMIDLKSNWDSLIENAKNISDKLNQEVPTCYACKQEIRGDNLKEIKLIFEEEKKKIGVCNAEMSKIERDKVEVDNLILEKEKIIKDLNTKKDNALSDLEEWKKVALKDLSDYRDDKLSKLSLRENEAVSKKNNIDNRKKFSLNEIELKYINILSKEHSELETSFRTSISELENNLKKMEEEKTSLDELVLRENSSNNTLNSNEGIIRAKKEELNNMLTSSYKNGLDEYNNRIQRLSSVVSDNEARDKEIKKKISESERKIFISKFWKKAFSPKGIRAILLDESIPILNEKAKELSSNTDCIRVRFSSQKPLKSGGFKNQFCVLPIQTKNLTDEREDFSQGEGRMVDIITLLSLRYLLEQTYERTFNISLFDEILDSLYKDNAEVVIDFLRKMSEESCTILITHTLRNDIDPDEHLELGK